MAVPDEARMWPKHTRDSVLAQIDRKLESFRGGCIVLYIAGRRPWRKTVSYRWLGYLVDAAYLFLRAIAALASAAPLKVGVG